MHAHGHHHHGLGERLRADRRRLGIALGLIVAFMAVEVVAGLFADSLALLADAGHMLTDAASLALALAAAWLAATPPTPQRSFGLRRAEILAALVERRGAVVIAGLDRVSRPCRRFRDPPEPLGGWMLAVGLLGLVVNLGAAAVMAGGRDGSLNVRAAYRHVLADLAGSVGVVAAGVVVLATGWQYADPIAALAIAGLVLVSAWSVLRESVGVLLEEHAARDRRGRGWAGISPGTTACARCTTCTSGRSRAASRRCRRTSSSTAAPTATRLRRELEEVLAERFGLTHTTLQVDHIGEPPTRSPCASRSPRAREASAA